MIIPVSSESFVLIISRAFSQTAESTPEYMETKYFGDHGLIAISHRFHNPLIPTQFYQVSKGN